ncbi:MAG: PAS domain S-box protein [Deltaproteobacteria bacterium]|uniref:histidine kinase n=1 Tax=Candidatus Zymogenus saltonus TaxID=2844893 RepID=A0A9D8KEY8_9DELT|nr:PAS domain S-box protein [Candidatus Zymogenus saltonus]
MTDIRSLKIAGALQRFPEPVFVTDGEGFVLYINPASENLIGYSSSEILGLPLFRFVSEGDKGVLKDSLLKVISEEGPSTISLLLLKKDGEELRVSFSLSPIFADEGEEEGERACLFFAKGVSPITLSATDKSLFDFLVSTLNALKEGIVVTDLKGVILYANPRMESIFASTPNGLSGLNIRALLVSDGGDDLFSKIIDRERGGGWEGELVALKRSGKKVNIRIATLIVRDNNGNISFIIFLIHDITKEMEMRNEMIHINKELSVLYAISTTLSESIELDELLNISLSKVLKVMGMDKGIVRIADMEREDLALKAHMGISPEYIERYEHMPMEGSVSGRVAKTGVPYLADKETDSDPEKDVALMQEGLRQVIIIPLRSKDRTLGTMSVGGYNPRTSTFQDIKLLTSIGSLFGVAIENSLIFERADMLAKEKAVKVVELTLLSDLSHALMTTIELDRLLYIVLTTVTMGESFGFNRAALFLVDENEKAIVGRMGVGPISMEDAGRIWSELEREKYQLQELVERGFKEHGSADAIQNRILRKINIPLSRSDDVIVKSLKGNRPIIVRDIENNPHVDKRMTRILMGDREFACVPIVAMERPLGVLLVDNVFNRKPIVEEDVNLLWAFANQAGLAIQNSMMYTNQAKINRELREAQAKLLQQAKLVGLGEMATEVAHEIRNPLVSIGGFARKLSEQAGEDNKLKMYSDIIVKEVLKLEHTLLNILSLPKDIPPSFEEVDLNSIIHDTLNLVEDDLMPRGIEMEIHLEESLPIIEADGAQMRQVFLNLFYNAIQAMRNGGSLGVATSAEDISGKKYVKVVVSDTGEGVPAEIIGEIFKPFFTTKSSGTGLGLAITHKIVTSHGGNIDIINKPEGGASFIVEIPVRRSSRG